MCLLSFGWDLSPKFVPEDLKYIFYSSLPGLKGRFVCVWNWLIFFLGEYSFVLPEICRVVSQIHSRFFRRISKNKDFGIIFQKFCANQGYPLPKLVKFRPTFCNFVLGLCCIEKIHTSTFICCLHPGKEARSWTNHKKKIGIKCQDVLFSEIQFCSLSVWDLLRLTPGVF